MPKLDVNRRETLAWLTTTILISGCSPTSAPSNQAPGQGSSSSKQFLLGAPKAPDGKGYSFDPDLIEPVVPWQLTMTEKQLACTSSLCSLILPSQESTPAGGDLGYQDFVNEWVSAPYPTQLNDRGLIFELLEYLEQNAIENFGQSFSKLSFADAGVLVDRVAYKDRITPELKQLGEGFVRLRNVILCVHYTSEIGVAELGYLGNTPIIGEYPGPPPEAVAHLRAGLLSLGIEL